jgi:hypothetical protein
MIQKEHVDDVQTQEVALCRRRPYSNAKYLLTQSALHVHGKGPG